LLLIPFGAHLHIYLNAKLLHPFPFQLYLALCVELIPKMTDKFRILELWGGRKEWQHAIEALMRADGWQFTLKDWAVVIQMCQDDI